MELKDRARVEFYLPESRLAQQSGAFVEKTVMIYQPLGKGPWIMGIGLKDLIAIAGDSRLLGKCSFNRTGWGGKQLDAGSCWAFYGGEGKRLRRDLSGAWPWLQGTC